MEGPQVGKPKVPPKPGSRRREQPAPCVGAPRLPSQAQTLRRAKRSGGLHPALSPEPTANPASQVPGTLSYESGQGWGQILNRRAWVREALGCKSKDKQLTSAEGAISWQNTGKATKF